MTLDLNLSRRQVVIITGMSGAGRSSALKNLEDLGFEAIDNLPIDFFGRIVSAESSLELPVHLAVGVDIRNRHFNVETFVKEILPLRKRQDIQLTVIFMDCDESILNRRFTETRRLHPLANDRPVTDGIHHERKMLQPILAASDFIIDTTQLSLPDLRLLIEARFLKNITRNFVVSLVSFAYGKGLPREADLVFDVRFLKNPHYDDELKGQSGLDKSVAKYIRSDENFQSFYKSLTQMIDDLLPRYYEEGKNYLTIGIGCTGGRHRSVFVAESLGEHLTGNGHRALVRHRDKDMTEG